ncbi:MAG: hypothetical protein K0R31_288 [Clostridiales bacterium]|nr:hypothetical protein [Clostridiales bacterium]
MAEFCTCGSIKIEGNCTNKNCASNSSGKTAATKSSTRKTAAVKKEPKTRRASKVITYNLYENNNSEENID